MAEKHYSRHEAAALLCLSITTLKRELKARRLGFRKLGTSKSSRVLIPESEIDKYLRRYSTLHPAVEDCWRPGGSPPGSG